MNHRDDVIDRYERGGAILAAAVAGVSDDLARKPVGPGAWSLAELTVHLLDSDLVGIDRMKRVIAEETPVLQAYDENAWIARLKPNAMPIAEAAALFASNRAWTARILRGCDDADFARVGMHTEDGEKSLAKLLTGYISHLDDHLRFLYGKRGALGIGIAPRYSRD